MKQLNQTRSIRESERVEQQIHVARGRRGSGTKYVVKRDLLILISRGGSLEFLAGAFGDNIILTFFVHPPPRFESQLIHESRIGSSP